MKSTKKVILTAGILFQLSASMYADNWSDAFLAFGGGSDPVAAAQFVLNSPNAVTASSALSVSQGLNTPEGTAVARWMSNSKKAVFKSPLQNSDVQYAAQSIAASAPTKTVLVNAPAPAPIVRASTPATTVNNSVDVNDQIAKIKAAAEAQVAKIQAIADDNIKIAMQTQQQQDAARAAQQQQALTNVVNSGATGASLYNAYIDLIMNSLQQALNSIVDADVKQQVIGYAKNKLINMQSIASVNSHNSHALGRMSSKKQVKKSKHSRAHVIR